MQKNKTQLTEDLTTFNIDQLDKYIKINGGQAITGLLFNSVLKNLVQRNQDDIDSNFNLLTNDTDDLNPGTQNRFNLVVESLTDRDNLDPHTDPILGLNVGDISVVQENLDSNIEVFVWNGSQWVQLYEVVGTQLDVKVVDVPQTTTSAVNQGWVEDYVLNNSPAAAVETREYTEGGNTYTDNFTATSILNEITDGVNTSTIEMTPLLITMTDTTIAGLTVTGNSNSIKVQDIPATTSDAVNKYWVQNNSEMRLRRIDTGSVVYKIDFNLAGDEIDISIDDSFDNSSISVRPNRLDITTIDLRLQDLPTYADEAAAIIAGLSTNQVYKTASGELRIKL